MLILVMPISVKRTFRPHRLALNGTPHPNLSTDCDIVRKRLSLRVRNRFLVTSNLRNLTIHQSTPIRRNLRFVSPTNDSRDISTFFSTNVWSIPQRTRASSVNIVSRTIDLTNTSRNLPFTLFSDASRTNRTVHVKGRLIPV